MVGTSASWLRPFICGERGARATRTIIFPRRSMPMGSITGAQVAQYDEDGYVLIRQMFASGEIELLARAAREDRALDEHSFGRSDGEGGTVRLSLWNHPGDTIYGMVARCESIVG